MLLISVRQNENENELTFSSSKVQCLCTHKVQNGIVRSGQNHFARHSKRGKKTRQTEEEVGRQHHGKDRPGVLQGPEGSGEQGKLEQTGFEIICGALTTLAVKG